MKALHGNTSKTVKLQHKEPLWNALSDEQSESVNGSWGKISSPGFALSFSFINFVRPPTMPLTTPLDILGGFNARNNAFYAQQTMPVTTPGTTTGSTYSFSNWLSQAQSFGLFRSGFTH